MAEQYINEYNDGSKKPWKQTADTRGVTDWGNLLKFAPFEGGYSFLIVLTVPFDIPVLSEKGGFNHGFMQLQNNFVNILEEEFRGLSGIEDITGETYELGNQVAAQDIINRVKGLDKANISMNFTEKTGLPITKYISHYLKMIRNPYSQIKSWNGSLKTRSDVANKYGPYGVRGFREVFNILYVITDATCLNVEKAFLLLNARPLSASYNDLFNTEKGNISSKEITVNFSCNVREGAKVNAIANKYMQALIKTNINNGGLIDMNSYNQHWSVSGTIKKTSADTGIVGVNKINKLRPMYTSSGHLEIAATDNGLGDSDFSKLSVENYEKYEGLKNK